MVGMHTNHLKSLESSGSLEKLSELYSLPHLPHSTICVGPDVAWKGLCDLTQMLRKHLEQGIKSRGVKA